MSCEQEQERTKSGLIRLFRSDTNTETDASASADRTLREWIQYRDQHPEFEPVFYESQRKRWLARWTVVRWTQRVWRKRTQCNVELIEMEPIPDADAVFITDTKHHMIYKFHYRDVFTNLLENLKYYTPDMLPAPKKPTNPWTNAEYTFAQTLVVCQSLLAHFLRKGQCPPPLFSAFWQSRFDIKRFQQENAAFLSQAAIANFFKELTDENRAVVNETIILLLQASGRMYSSHALQRWLQTPIADQTILHREWVALVRDFTLYSNLHVQVRPHWNSRAAIHADVRSLYARTTNTMRPVSVSNATSDSATSEPVLLQFTMRLDPFSMGPALATAGSATASATAADADATLQMFQGLVESLFQRHM